MYFIFLLYTSMSKKWNKENLVKHYFQKIKGMKNSEIYKNERSFIDWVLYHYKEQFPKMTMKNFISFCETNKVNNSNSENLQVEINWNKITFPIKNEQLKEAKSTLNKVISMLSSSFNKFIK